MKDLIKQKSLWRRTPPAVFPVCLGLLGLGLGWRNAADILPVAHEIGDILLGFGSAYFLYFLVFFLRKLVARPAVLFEDMVSPSARAGVAAAAMSMMLLAAALLPLGLSVPQVWWTGVVLQIAASAVVVHAIWYEPASKRHFTPYQYLTFVGPVVGPVAGIPLGYVWQSYVLIIAALVPYLAITLGYARALIRARPQLLMRPILAIFLAPNCLFAIGFGLLGVDWAFSLFYGIANIVALVLLVLTPWLVKGGYTPAWAAFTFPLAAFLQVQVLALSKGAGRLAEIGAWAGLAIATPVILYVVYRISMGWVTGELAERTGAATA